MAARHVHTEHADRTQCVYEIGGQAPLRFNLRRTRFLSPRHRNRHDDARDGQPHAVRVGAAKDELLEFTKVKNINVMFGN